MQVCLHAAALSWTTVLLTASKHHLPLIDQLRSPCPPKAEVIGVALDTKLRRSVVLLLQLNLAESLACARLAPKADLMTGGTYWNSINAPLVTFCSRIIAP